MGFGRQDGERVEMIEKGGIVCILIGKGREERLVRLDVVCNAAHILTSCTGQSLVKFQEMG